MTGCGDGSTTRCTGSTSPRGTPSWRRGWEADGYAIWRVRGREYKVEQAVGLYPTAGASDDYAYSRHLLDRQKGKIIAFTVEWGRSRSSTPFHPPYDEMRKVMREVTAGLLELCLNVGRWLKETRTGVEQVVLNPRSLAGGGRLSGATHAAPSSRGSASRICIKKQRHSDRFFLD